MAPSTGSAALAGFSRLVGRALGVRRRLQIQPSASRHPGGPVGSVLVIGGGIAGMSAAVVMAERGFPVMVWEQAPQLGGRLCAVPHTLPDGTEQPIDHGFHGFFRQYYNWRAVLSRIDPDGGLLQPLGSYPVVSSRFPDEQFDALPPTPPVSIAALVARSPSLRLGELRHANQDLARELLAYHGSGTPRRLDRLSARDFLAELGLPDRARAMLFNVFAHSFFNDAGSMSAAELVAMFHFYFLANPEGLGMDAPRADYQTAIWTPLQRYAQRHRVEFEFGRSVTRLEHTAAGRWRGHAGAESIEVDRVVLAADARSAGSILAASPEITERDPRLRAAATAPFVGPPYAVARYWLSGEVGADRAVFTSIGDAQELDSITLYHRFDPHARRWHERTGGAVVELHAYACNRNADSEHVADTMLSELTDLWPEVAASSVVHRRCRIGHDAAGFPVGRGAQRPGTRTALPGLELAGDWVGSPVPAALMERAALTGIRAANQILTCYGHPVEPIWSVPTRGLLGARAGSRR
ncbi:dehydrogenase [Actinocatenispora thailandica]|uniref:Dehydrogenase n=1 Tax=Actinocatenispora thailandica TaxID=227318 RepID=A0A7R7DM04_9ACTN|nr:FAD-dependent oxidoreductase [Actinocatenispora thailandica]BCJ33961.1 dehydrogenase [Actinocatenispora thailandica]